MAILKNFIYCLNAEKQNDIKGQGEAINALGVLSVLTPEFIPGLFSFSIVFSILDIGENNDNQIKVVFRDENNSELVNTDNISIPSIENKNDINLPSKYIGYNLSMDFRNVIFEKEGEYFTDIYFNGTLLGSKSIYVKGRR